MTGSTMTSMRPNIHELPNPYIITCVRENVKKANKNASMVAFAASKSAALYASFAECIIQNHTLRKQIKIMEKITPVLIQRNDFYDVPPPYESCHHSK